jgi:hypothetical protein
MILSKMKLYLVKNKKEITTSAVVVIGTLVATAR